MLLYPTRSVAFLFFFSFFLAGSYAFRVHLCLRVHIRADRVYRFDDLTGTRSVYVLINDEPHERIEARTATATPAAQYYNHADSTVEKRGVVLSAPVSPIILTALTESGRTIFLFS